MSLTPSARPETTRVSRKAPWAGRILSPFAVLFLLVDGPAKVLELEPVTEACIRLEVPEQVIPGLGAVPIAPTLLHALPATSILGAIAPTGHLGGAGSTSASTGCAPVALRRAAPGWNRGEVR